MTSANQKLYRKILLLKVAGGIPEDTVDSDQGELNVSKPKTVKLSSILLTNIFQKELDNLVGR